MKQASLTQKPARSIERNANQNAAVGPNGIAMAPPTYGIDLVGRQPVQAVLALSQESQPLQSSTWSIQGGSIQKKSPAASPSSNSPAVQQENKTGLPDKLKTGIETLSGLAMDDVKVHYKSTKPAQLKALAYTQGTDIHVGRGQERHLPHEAWHVVQQKQRRVKPTRQMNGQVQVNDDLGLEKEAEVMGQKALRQSSQPQAQHPATTPSSAAVGGYRSTLSVQPKVVQRTRSGELATVVQCQPVISKEDLISLLTPLKSSGGSLKKSAIVQAITKYLEEKDIKVEDLREPQFAWDLMEVINELSIGKAVDIQDAAEALIDIEEPKGRKQSTYQGIYQMISGYRWTLRHYTISNRPNDEPSFDFIRSHAESEIRKAKEKSAPKNKVGSTGEKDWNVLGNTAFVFFLIAINGEAPQRDFLKDRTHYAECDMSDPKLSNLWVSGDLLKTDKDTINKDDVYKYKGSGVEVKELLAKKVAKHLVTQGVLRRSVTPKKTLAALDEMHLGALEVKIPGGLSVNRWIKK